jgi:hypothetical protein
MLPVLVLGGLAAVGCVLFCLLCCMGGDKKSAAINSKRSFVFFSFFFFFLACSREPLSERVSDVAREASGRAVQEDGRGHPEEKSRFFGQTERKSRFEAVMMLL